MPTHPSGLRATLFYSYSHKDAQYKRDMETVLSTLKHQGLLRDWSDAQITPGQRISETIPAKQSASQIHAFLMSPDFLASDECIREWERAKELAESGNLVFRIPIIVHDCPWKTFLGEDDVRALPDDGKPIANHASTDSAWTQVHQGILHAIETLRTTFTPKPAFLTDLNTAGIPSSTDIVLNDIFIFPRLVQRNFDAPAERLQHSKVTSLNKLLDLGSSIIHGQEKSGKTALAKQLVLSLIEAAQPVLLADLRNISSRPGRRYLQRLYEDQFNGDYSIWRQASGTTLVIDNMTEIPSLLNFVEDCSNEFSRIYIFASSDVFYSLLMDDPRLTDFQQVRVEPITHRQQEQLIRKRLTLIERDDPLTDGFVDEAEDRVNSVILANRIVPRYPFFVLSILQTFDTNMPPPFPITSYGHCYFIFIVASLRRAGIPESDAALNSCFNFAGQLAIATFLAEKDPQQSLDYESFKREYSRQFLSEDWILNRLTHREFGIITSDGKFKTAYMYYYFLGKLLATDTELRRTYLTDLCENSHIESNYLTLVFAIHHASDQEIIEEIMVHMLVELEDVDVATLHKGETARFNSIVSQLPESVLSTTPVAEQRAQARHNLDALDEEVEHIDEDAASTDERVERSLDDLSSKVLRILKNNKILGQVLRNQSGKLKKGYVEEIIGSVADSSFQMINLVLKDEEEIRILAHQIQRQHPDADIDEIREILTWTSFFWTMISIEEAVHAVGIPSIREAVDSVVSEKNTPAYDIFGFYSELDSAEGLTQSIRRRLDTLYKNYDRHNFVKRVLSIRTQMYMNTHMSDTSVEQSICSVLGIQYKPRRTLPEASSA